MVTVDKAIGLILEQTPLIETERVPINDALGRVLAEDIISKREHPPWDNSAMDGYALVWQDIKDATPETPVTLHVVGEVQAGDMPTATISTGKTIQIMTGAPMPDGADSVVRVEDTERVDAKTVKILAPCRQGANIRLKGEDIHHHAKVITSGTLCRPAEIGMLATAGYSNVAVYKKPVVSVLATGNELVEPGDDLEPGKIINSNSYSITALVADSGGNPTTLETAKDTREDLTKKISQALSADVSIIIGGVSMGKYDYVKDVLAELGCDMKFWKVAMRPGHPMAFGIMTSNNNTKLLFGLPGNPVACMVTFYQFVRPALRKMTGMNDLFLNEVEAELDESIKHHPGRRHYARAITTYNECKYSTRLTGDQGSGMLTSMVQANSFLVLPEEGGEYNAGDRLKVQLLP